MTSTRQAIIEKALTGMEIRHWSSLQVESPQMVARQRCLAPVRSQLPRKEQRSEAGTRIQLTKLSEAPPEVSSASADAGSATSLATSNVYTKQQSATGQITLTTARRLGGATLHERQYRVRGCSFRDLQTPGPMRRFVAEDSMTRSQALNRTSQRVLVSDAGIKAWPVSRGAADGSYTNSTGAYKSKVGPVTTNERCATPPSRTSPSALLFGNSLRSPARSSLLVTIPATI